MKKWIEVSPYSGIEEDAPANNAGSGNVSMPPDAVNKKKKKTVIDRNMMDARTKIYKQHRTKLEMQRARREELKKKSKFIEKVKEGTSSEVEAEVEEGVKSKLVAVRKKMQRRMSKLAKSSAFQTKKKKASLRVRDPAKLLMAARKKVMNQYRDKVAPDYKSLGIPQRIVIDNKIRQMYSKKMEKKAKKLMLKMKKTELERVKQARQKLQGKS